MGDITCYSTANNSGLNIFPQGKFDSWWLHMAMVHRDYQKMGVTRALINLVREKVRQGSPYEAVVACLYRTAFQASVSGDTLACSTTNDNNVRSKRTC